MKKINIFTSAFIMLTLSGCSDYTNWETRGPDASGVELQKYLILPPNFELKAPVKTDTEAKIEPSNNEVKNSNDEITVLDGDNEKKLSELFEDNKEQSNNVEPLLENTKEPTSINEENLQNNVQQNNIEEQTNNLEKKKNKQSYKKRSVKSKQKLKSSKKKQQKKSTNKRVNQPKKAPISKKNSNKNIATKKATKVSNINYEPISVSSKTENIQ